MSAIFVASPHSSMDSPTEYLGIMACDASVALSSSARSVVIRGKFGQLGAKISLRRRLWKAIERQPISEKGRNRIRQAATSAGSNCNPAHYCSLAGLETVG